MFLGLGTEMDCNCDQLRKMWQKAEVGQLMWATEPVVKTCPIFKLSAFSLEFRLLDPGF